ncbi:hypothetical protein TVAG_263500 [Trichomonas vaginalis G3]|uniref:Uncharacterized protein n=1 Tax=Trichomonas vaginalis (strain ATCC PRA-98 / G3) TaxID=412133 RepID=A2G5F3_TRIV3|nr:hypothetical protein TVAGG3_0796610 [Trichomonas vaginalis G3]EAX87612.1 hypothetical protein TVAG_263500 [Trichomonas vaginalis G3]KAI5496216.1 hypothetical protein TVAGG3_0796610 [Trichomonas vaginalis G3]|eukprot:XP_001300542.1 hypothetical protein [Trichomonas vaginalis G3]
MDNKVNDISNNKLRANDIKDDSKSPEGTSIIESNESNINSSSNTTREPSPVKESCDINSSQNEIFLYDPAASQEFWDDYLNNTPYIDYDEEEDIWKYY